VPTQSLIPSSLDLASVPTGDAFLEALQAHDSHFGALRAEAARQGGGAVLRYVGVIDVNAGNGGGSVKASLERCVPSKSNVFSSLMSGSKDTRRRTRLLRHLAGRTISSCSIRSGMARVH
jgi:hypothetical protein